ncbi:hypothetical protein J3B02_000032 [Coemansia erecta]|uniref:Uncharacterized protein n=1 Tax=Coemansia asiatica TaxID=1052880 RepID=A0A9W7XPQ1_9FUNG|nr:hypothetical protein LPJ64_001562 [Coemansia asiatica]KAJ2858651.1 hypothetical protein J3B02_000032 [Coemansia erecta]KAJ2885712.1 hypothetical protein FB639_001716 [Coemansia asiatica]
MGFFASPETSDGESMLSSGSTLTNTTVIKKNEYKIIDNKERFQKFNNKYTNGIFIFHRLEESQLEDFVKKVKLCSIEKRRIGVIDVRDRWCQNIAPASCKDHPYVQWYSNGKKVLTPVEVKFQYAKLIGSTLATRSSTMSPAADLAANTLFVTPSPFVAQCI